jgi:hypothetical protein
VKMKGWHGLTMEQRSGGKRRRDTRSPVDSELELVTKLVGTTYKLAHHKNNN